MLVGGDNFPEQGYSRLIVSRTAFQRPYGRRQVYEDALRTGTSALRSHGDAVGEGARWVELADGGCEGNLVSVQDVDNL